MIKKMVLFTILPIFLIIILIASISSGNAGASSNIGTITAINISDDVLAYKSIVEKHCKLFNIEEYVNYILAIMMVESGGKGSDVMYSSESLGLRPGTLKPEDSIKQGCKVFSEHLKTADDSNCDVDTVIQAYNYGGSFITYISDRGKRYSFHLAEQFAKEKSNSETVPYLNDVSKPYGGWKYTYGNMFYVLLVKQYLVLTSNLGEYAKKFIGENHNRFTTYKSKNSQALGADWCAMFVSYCCDQLGYIDKGYISWFNSCNVDGYIVSDKWFYSRFYRGSYTPSAGDIIFFTSDHGLSSCHVGIVTACDGSTVKTVEGNSGESVVSPYWKGSHVVEHSYSLQANYIYGYYPLSTMIKVS